MSGQSRRSMPQQAPAPTAATLAGPQDFGSNGAMTEQLGAYEAHVISKSLVQVGEYAGDDEADLVIGAGEVHGLTVDTKVTSAGAWGRVTEVYKFRAKVRLYGRTLPDDVTVHPGETWDRKREAARVGEIQRAAGERAHREDQESEYGSRR